MIAREISFRLGVVSGFLSIFFLHDLLSATGDGLGPRFRVFSS